ncbi:hypothetical protein IGI58_002313 [Enterococcus sp. AZ020]
MELYVGKTEQPQLWYNDNSLIFTLFNESDGHIRMKKFLYISLGSFTFGLGTLGIFLPILPTTVFYLLTAFFWMRSSEKLYTRFINSSYYQKYIQESIVEKKITPLGRVKLFTTLFIIFAIPCLIVRNPFMTMTLSFVYVVHLIVLNLYFNKKNGKETEKPERS